jgi:hypothetical protein
MSARKLWSRADKLTAIGLFIAALALIVSVSVPEIRRTLHLERPGTAPPIATVTPPPMQTKPEPSPKSKTPQQTPSAVGNNNQSGRKIVGSGNVVGNTVNGNGNVVGNNNQVIVMATRNNYLPGPIKEELPKIQDQASAVVNQPQSATQPTEQVQSADSPSNVSQENCVSTSSTDFCIKVSLSQFYYAYAPSGVTLAAFVNGTWRSHPCCGAMGSGGWVKVFVNETYLCMMGETPTIDGSGVKGTFAARSVNCGPVVLPPGTYIAVFDMGGIVGVDPADSSKHYSMSLPFAVM